MAFGQNSYLASGTQYLLSGGLPGDQTRPQISLNGSGGYMVWQDNVTDGDGFGMHAELWYLPRERLSLATVWNDDAIHTPDLPHALLQSALNSASSRGLAEP